MEEKLEQIIAEKFDKMGLNNDDDDDEDDNLAPFRKSKKANRVEKRVQKAIAGIENKLYAGTFGQLSGNQQIQPQMGVLWYNSRIQLVTTTCVIRPVWSTSDNCSASGCAATTVARGCRSHGKGSREDAVERMEALFESKMKEKDQSPPSSSFSSAYARTKSSSKARGDDDMPKPRRSLPRRRRRYLIHQSGTRQARTKSPTWRRYVRKSHKSSRSPSKKKSSRAKARTDC